MDTIELKVKIYQTIDGKSQIIEDTVSEFCDNAEEAKEYWEGNSSLIYKIGECIADSYGMFRAENLPSLDGVETANDLEAYVELLNKKAAHYAEQLGTNIHVNKVEVENNTVYDDGKTAEIEEEVDPAEELYNQLNSKVVYVLKNCNSGLFMMTPNIEDACTRDLSKAYAYSTEERAKLQQKNLSDKNVETEIIKIMEKDDGSIEIIK